MSDSNINKALDSEVDPRAQQLLKLLVEHYIEKGAPVSSKQLATESALKISSATVRNVMADLEAMGRTVDRPALPQAASIL